MHVGDLGIWPVIVGTGKNNEEGRNRWREVQGQYQTDWTFKRGGELRSLRLSSYNKYNVLATEINVDILKSEGNKKMEVRKVEGRTLREVTVKIGLERIDTQEGITVKVLLDSGATGLVMSSEFAKKQGFKLKKLERPIQVRNVDRTFNQEGPIENTVEMNIYYQGHRERTEIDVIRGQKWKVILGMLWLVCHNPEIDWRTGEVKMTRCPEECGKQWRPVQGKSGWEKQKEEEKKKKAEKRKEEKEKRNKQKRGGTVEVRKITEDWEIWDEEEEAAKSEEEAKKLVPEKFHRWIKVFGKKQLERMPTRKLWDHAIDVKEGFMPRKGKVYPLSREEREEVREFVKEQLRKGYIQPSKSPQTAPASFVGKKDGKKRMVQDY